MGHVVAVSHCLLGCNCRYDGTAKPHEEAQALAEREDLSLVPVCPERAARLGVPRLPAERVGRHVLMADGTDVTEAFTIGAYQEAARVLNAHCDVAVLKANSPSCGTGCIYDGTFSGHLTNGWGVFAEMLHDAGIRCLSEEELAEL